MEKLFRCFSCLFSAIVGVTFIATASLAEGDVTKDRVMCRSESPPLQTVKMVCYVGEQQRGLNKFIWEYYKAGFYVTAAYYDPRKNIHFVFLKKD